MYFTLLNNKNQYAIDNFLSENSLSKKCANYQFLLAYVRKLCYYHKAISICPHGQAVQDVALSRRKLGFDSLWGYQTKDISLRYVFLFYKYLMGIERADRCTIQRIVRPPRRASADLSKSRAKTKKMRACVVRVSCIGQAARFPMGVPKQKNIS